MSTKFTLSVHIERWGFFIAVKTQEPIPKMQIAWWGFGATMKAVIDLQLLYRELNKNYFNNELPDVPVYIKPRSYFLKKKWGKDTLGKKTVAITLFDYGKPVCIILKDNAQRSYSDVKFDLLHEMVHVKNPKAECGENSKYFKKELRRLVKAGALDDIW